MVIIDDILSNITINCCDTLCNNNIAIQVRSSPQYSMENDFLVSTLKRWKRTAAACTVIVWQ